MEEAAWRVAHLINDLPGYRVVVYVLDDGYPLPLSCEHAFDLCTIGVDVHHQSKIIPASGEAKLERLRLKQLALERQVRKRLETYAHEAHVILSFFLDHPGFMANWLSRLLNLPHIASARGSDLGRNYLDPGFYAGIKTVVENACAVVVTNETQARQLASIFGVSRGVTLIYNSMAETDVIPFPPFHGDRIRFFSDTG
jgi:hypothetical protein